MAIVNLAALDQTPLRSDPFDFVVVENAIEPGMLEALNRDYPEIDKPANYAPEDLSYGPAFGQLLDELHSAEFERRIARKFGVNLEGATRTVTVRRYSEPSDGNIHTDHWSKIITLLVYFNPEWTQEGGRLRFLRSKDDIEDYAVEVAPQGGTVLAFRRSDKSFHGYKQFHGERRMVQMSWVKPGRLAWYAQQFARAGTHTAKRLLRWSQPSA